MASSRQAFLRLVRAPNLLSVPGDPLGGVCLALLASGAAAPPAAAALLRMLPLAALAAVAAYAAGLIDNDLVDLPEDRQLRPERPLPSGDISIRTAAIWRAAFLLLPLLPGFAGLLPPVWLGVYLLLAATILAYNRLKNIFPRCGYFLMGLCRGLSLLAGVAAVAPDTMRDPAIWLAVAGWTSYIAAVTLFAAFENERSPGWRRYLVLLAPIAMFVGGGLLLRWRNPAGLPLLLAGLAGLFFAGYALYRCGSFAPPAVARPTVGRLIRTLFPMQLALCLAAPYPAGWLIAVLLGCCWLAAVFLSRRYAAS